MLAALQALVKHEPLFQMMGVDNSETQDFRTVAAAFARVFSKQSTSIEVTTTRAPFARTPIFTLAGGRRSPSTAIRILQRQRYWISPSPNTRSK